MTFTCEVCQEVQSIERLFHPDRHLAVHLTVPSSHILPSTDRVPQLRITPSFCSFIQRMGGDPSGPLLCARFNPELTLSSRKLWFTHNQTKCFPDTIRVEHALDTTAEHPGMYNWQVDCILQNVKMFSTCTDHKLLEKQEVLLERQCLCESVIHFCSH